MALHDLTPQLRTRLSRFERLVGLFVAVAVVLLVAGLAYYAYRVAERKGWFVRKLPYFTFVDNANGLRVGDPIRLMGFDVGEITEVTAQPPFDYYDVYVAFVVKEEHVGYLWDDSWAVVASTDLLGKRSIEVTKGTNGPPTYLFHPLRSIPVPGEGFVVATTNLILAQAIYDANGRTQLVPPLRPVDSLGTDLLSAIRAAGVETLLVYDDDVWTRKGPTAVWDFKEARYRPYQGKADKGYFLPPREAPALATRLERVADLVESALPNLLGLTNRINRVLDQANATAQTADDLLNDTRPLVTHLTRISANLTNAQGAFGEWALPPELRRQLTQTLASAETLLVNSDQHVDGMSSNVTTVLLQLASLTSNLNAQVVANSNILSEISAAVTNADHLMQGLKRHWLLRSAFKPGKTSPPPEKSGKQRGNRTAPPK